MRSPDLTTAPDGASGAAPSPPLARPGWREGRRAAPVILVAAYAVVLMRTAWIGDDAAITLRTVLNFIHGYGPTFNVAERVQAYTHPLWFLLVSALTALVRNPFVATFLLSIGLSLAVMWLLLARISPRAPGAMVAAAALLLSKAFVDYSTSGLENPLTHLLLLAAVLLALRAAERRDRASLALFATCGSLLYLTRPDVPLLVLPLAAWVAYRSRGRPATVAAALALGLLPALAWTAFSVYYYGFPFPNTAYAKLGTGIPLAERAMQGLRYWAHTLRADPLTVAFLLAGMAVGAASAGAGRSLSLGMALYLLYAVSIGGDFMEGRLFAAPLLVAAVLVARARPGRVQLSAAAAGVAALGAVSLRATLLSPASYSDRTIAGDGIADERGYYFQQSGLIAAPAGALSTPDWSMRAPRTVILCGGLGFFSLQAGPAVRLIDTCALADPLLARLPARYDPGWRIGHFVRQLPTGYQDSVALGANALTDPATRSFYEVVRTITRGALNDPARWRAIVRMNLGRVPAPHPRMYRYDAVPRSLTVDFVAAERLRTPVDDGVPWDAPGNVRFPNALEVGLERELRIRELDLSADNNDTYRVDVLSGGVWTPVATIDPVYGAGLVRHRLTLAHPAAPTQLVRITALDGDGMYAVGHLIVR